MYTRLFTRFRGGTATVGRSRGWRSRKCGGRGDAGARRVNPLTEAGRSPSQHLGERKVESTPRLERNPSQHLGERKVESTPRPERNPSQHLGGREVESTPRPERSPSQHLGREVESTPRPERSPSRNVGIMVLLSSPRVLGKGIGPVSLNRPTYIPRSGLWSVRGRRVGRGCLCAEVCACYRRVTAAIADVSL